MPVFLKLLGSMVACTVVPIVLLLFFVSWIHQGQTRKHVLDHLGSVAALQKNRVNDIRQYSLESLALLCSRTQLRLSLKQLLESGSAESRERMNLILQDAQQGVEVLQQIDVVSVDGKVVASTNAARIGTAPYTSEFVRQSLELNTADAIIRVPQSEPFLRSAGPLRLEQEVIGAIVADSSLTSLASTIRDYSGLGDTGESLLGINTEKGSAYVFPPRYGESGDEKIESDLLQAALSSNASMLHDTEDYRGERVLAISHRIDGPGWALIVKIDEDEAFSALATTRWTIFIVGFIAVVLLTGAAYGFSRSLGGPLSRLATVSRQIQRGDLGCRSSDEQRRDEIGQLATAFNAMAETLVAANHELEEQVGARTVELEAAVHELDRSNRELEQFASIASHDLQTPIRNVATAVDLLRRQLDAADLNEKAQRYMKHLEDSSEMMQSQIEGLMALSRVHSRGRDTSAAVDTQTLVTRLIDDLRHPIEDTNANVHVDQLPATHGDASQLRQVFQNLIENALKYQEPGTLPEVYVSGSQFEALCEFSVADNGLGIVPEFREKVFDMFKRLHHQREYKGTGIGLSLCQKIVERHGGRIWVEARADGKSGSVFKFTIPTGREEQNE